MIYGLLGLAAVLGLGGLILLHVPYVAAIVLGVFFFLAQLAGVDLSLAQQLMVVYLAILGGVGTAGVPSGSIPFIILVLAQIGVNPALIAIILGVDRILDMCRTTLNVVGDITIATFVARSEGYELLKETPEPAAVDL